MFNVWQYGLIDLKMTFNMVKNDSGSIGRLVNMHIMIKYKSKCF